MHYLPAIDLSPEPSVIKANRAKVLASRLKAQAELDAINAMGKANQAMCKHPNKTSYCDPRDWGWNCPDCGAGA